jgi:ribosomal protein S30
METLRDEKERKDEQIRVENRQEHQMIIEKIDKLLERISK